MDQLYRATDVFGASLPFQLSTLLSLLMTVVFDIYKGLIKVARDTICGSFDCVFCAKGRCGLSLCFPLCFSGMQIYHFDTCRKISSLCTTSSWFVMLLPHIQNNCLLAG